MTVIFDVEPFWTKNPKGVYSVESYLLKHFLHYFGFGQFQNIRKRTSDKILFQKDLTVLKIHNETTVKKWVREFLEMLSEDDFNDTFKTDKGERLQVLYMWQDYTETSIKHITKDLNIWSEEQFSGTDKITLFTNDEVTACVIFENGVVEITKDRIELLPLESLKGKGEIWETEFIHHEISLTEEDEGTFKEFFNRTMYRPKEIYEETDDWRNEYELTEKGQEELVALRTAYGYLLHSFNIPDESKVPFFIDEDSDSKNTNGRTGKTLVMDSIRNFKETSYQEGKKFKLGKEGGRFQFSNVDLDTKFIFVNDVLKDFDFEKMFSMIGSDMEVEGKGTNKFTIPVEKCPKIGITTNFVIGGTGTSFTGRRHIVEFGSYWARCNREKERVSDKKHIGGWLCRWKKGDEEWNHFFNFGFRCIQDYFKHGLVEGTNHNYEKKAIRIAIEGVGGDGQVTEWIDNWIRKTRLEKGYHLGEGISREQLYKDFCDDNLNLLHTTDEVTWTEKRFNKAVWDFVEISDGFNYNIENSNKGNTMSSRRNLVLVESGKQIPHIKITTDSDSIWLDDKPTEDIKEGMTTSQIDEVKIKQQFEKIDRYSNWEIREQEYINQMLGKDEDDSEFLTEEEKKTNLREEYIFGKDKKETVPEGVTGKKMLPETGKTREMYDRYMEAKKLRNEKPETREEFLERKYGLDEKDYKP